MKYRNSSIELLRIIGILMVISLHYSYWGIGYISRCEDVNTGIVFIRVVEMYGRLGCSLFALTTGYFLCEKMNTIYYGKIGELSIILFCYGVILTAIYYFVGFDIQKISALKSLLLFIYDNWYVVGYMILLLILPLLNLIINTLEPKAFKMLLIALIFFWSILPTITLNSPNWRFSNIDFFIVMYFIGAYISKNDTCVSNNKNLVIAILCMLIMATSVIVIHIFAIETCNSKWLKWVTYFKEYNMLPTLCAAVFLFRYCVYNTFYNRFINWMASSVLGVYIISDNYLMRDVIWNGIYPNYYYIAFPYFHWLIKIFVVLIVSIILDKIVMNILNKTILQYYHKHIIEVRR